MSQYIKASFLYRSKLLPSFFFDAILYPLQQKLLAFGLLNVFWVSAKRSKSRQNLLRGISQSFSTIYCRSLEFARDLNIFKEDQLILDIPTLKNTRKMGKEELYNLMWSLVFCKFVTKRTKRLLKSYLPDNYPVIKEQLD
jgi:hypothetical protein